MRPQPTPAQTIRVPLSALKPAIKGGKWDIELDKWDTTLEKWDMGGPGKLARR